MVGRGEGGGKTAVYAFDQNQARVPEGRCCDECCNECAPPGDPDLPSHAGEEVRAVHVLLLAGLAARRTTSWDVGLVLADLDDLRRSLLDHTITLLAGQLADVDGVVENTTVVETDRRGNDVTEDPDRGLERPEVLWTDAEPLDVHPLFAGYVGCVVHVHYLWVVGMGPYNYTTVILS